MTPSAPVHAQGQVVDRDAREKARTRVCGRGRDGPNRGSGGRSLESSHRSRGGRSRISSRPSPFMSPAASRKEVTLQSAQSRCLVPQRRSGRRPRASRKPESVTSAAPLSSNGESEAACVDQLPKSAPGDHVLGQAGGKIWGEARGEASHRPRAARTEGTVRSGPRRIPRSLEAGPARNGLRSRFRTECLVDGKLLRECGRT